MRPLLIGLFMLIGFVGVAQVIPKDGLIAYYPFDGNAQDQSSNNLHGTVMGPTLTTDRFGNPNSAYHFDGVDDMIDIPNNTLLKPPLPFSISLWIKPDGFSVQWAGIFSNDQADHAGMSLRYDPQDHYIIGDYSDAVGTTSDHRRSIHTSIPLSTEWQHVVFICRGPTDMDVYIDGRKDPVENYSGLGGPIGYTNAPSGIGYHIFSGIQHFFGAIDDLAFYGKALSECEVLQLYSNIDRGLVVSYPFSGNAQDISIHGLHGTVFGATLTEDRHGNPNSAYLFDGAGDKIDLPNHPLLKPQVPISVGLWLRPDAFGPAWGGVFSNDHEIGNHTGMTMYCNPTLKTLNGSIGDGGGNSPAHRRTVHSSKTLSTNWQHGVIVYRGANDFDLYLDGEKDLGVTYSGTGGDIAYSSAPPGIGYNTAAIPFYFLGALDDFNFYNRSLSSCEVRELFSPGRLFGIDSVLEICQNDTFEVSTDLFNPAWYFDGVFLDSTESISVEINHSGLLTAQGENYCGCFEVDSFQFEFYPFPDPRISFSDSIVCPSPSVEYSYAVKGFEESDFMWSIQGGEIIARPAKDSILVRWDEPDGLSLEVEEVPSWECNSKSLEFSIYTDSTHLDLLSLGFNQGFDQMELTGFSNHSVINTNTDLFLLNKPDSGSIALLEQQQVNTDVNTFFLDSSLGAQVNYYLLARLDACDDTIWSPVHNNVLLKVDIEEEGDKLAFHWNPYEAWEGDVEYGLMKFFPDGRVEEQALLLDTQIVMVFPHRFNTHCFFVEARATQKADLISRSNLACIEFEENDIIPNTITPNGDGLNDRFEIPILGNYSNSELRIYNRYGSEIFSSKQYQNDWPEGDIDSGIYYYILIIAGKENLTGYIQIIK